MQHTYSQAFFESHRDGAWRSARVIAPLVIDLVQPGSVVDVGCGTGTWLAVFRAQGVADVLGIDGAYVDRDALDIPGALFMAADLAEPIVLDRQFDLVVSLEVAEHLPPDSARGFVKSLIDLGPVVLFSAAVPGQGGEHHLNEQWTEYWVGLFEEHGYRPADVVRSAVWSSGEVEPWYAQNILLFVSPEAAAAHPRLAAAIAAFSREQMTIVHPGLFAEIGRQQRQRHEQALAAAEAERARADAAEKRAKALEVELHGFKGPVLAARERAEALSLDREQVPHARDPASGPPGRPRRIGSDPSEPTRGSVRTVLVVSAFPPEPAPEANHALHICEHLVKAGLVVHVLCKRGSITSSPGIVTHPVIQDWSWRDLPRVISCLRDVRPDVVLLLYIGWVYRHHPMITLLPTVCDSVVPGVPCVTQFENIDDYPYPHSFLGRRLRTVMSLWAGRKRLQYVFGTLLRDSARIIVLSSPHRARLLKQDPLVADKTAILPPPPLIRFSQVPPLTARTEVRESLGISPTELVLLYWGYIYPGKGLETLIEAFETVCRAYPNVRLVVVGGSLDFPTHPISCEDYFRLVRRLPETLGIADRVTWTGPFDWDSDIGSRYLYAGDICVLPFDYGVTLNNSTLAAATTHELPIVGTELPAGEDEGLEHGRNIFLYPPKDPQALAKAIQLVIDSPVLRDTLRRGAGELAATWHRWDTMTERLRSILESAVSSRSAPQAPAAGGARDGEAASIEPAAVLLSREVWSGENPPDAPDSPLVSVVVAVYNVEKYLAQCLDSLVNQTLANIEILVVNDASLDGSATIIEHYRARCPAIRVIACERNVGLASVRNLGMRAARGRYVAFMDGDDWADISMCEVLSRRALEHGSDVVIADTNVFYDDLKVFTKFFDHALRDTFDPRLRRLPFDILSHPRVLLVEPVAWTKLYKRAFLQEHRLQFEEGMNSYEDMIFHFSALLKARKVSLIDDRISYYRQNRPGQISGRTNRKVFEVFEIFDRIHGNLTAWNVPAAIWAVLVKVELRQFAWLMKDRVQEADKREFLGLASKQINRIPEPGFEAFMRAADPDDLPALFCLRRNWLPAYERVVKFDRRVFPPFFFALNWHRRPDAVKAAMDRNVAMFRHRATAPVRGFVTRVLSAAATEEKGSASAEPLRQSPAVHTAAAPVHRPVVESVVIGGRGLLFADGPGRAGLATAVSRMAADHYLSQTAVFREGDAVVDIGAHVGVFSICLALRYPFLRVYAVEPNPTSFALLLQNIALNGAGNVVPINKAVYGDAGTRVFYSDAWDSGRATLDRGVAFSYGLLQTEQVKTVSLPQLLAAHEIPHCRLLKVCAPGAIRPILQHLPKPGSVDLLCGEVDVAECSRTEVQTVSAQAARHHFWRTIRQKQGRTEYGWIHQMPRDVEEHAQPSGIPLATPVSEG